MSDQPSEEQKRLFKLSMQINSSLDQEHARLYDLLKLRADHLWKLARETSEPKGEREETAQLAIRFAAVCFRMKMEDEAKL